MQIRRVRTTAGLQHQEWRADGWEKANPVPAWAYSPFSSEWDIGTADRQLRTSEQLLPFQPLSFRDFMLYEKHNIDASRGYARRFMPAAYRVTQAYETLRRAPFPRFTPPRLFYRQPMYYMGNHLAFVPSGTPIGAPSYSSALDYELELGFVLAEPLLDATPEEALAAVGAFVLVNDFSARDVQKDEMDSGFGLQKAKHFASSMSSTAVTADEILPYLDQLTGTVRLDGKTVATVSSAGMQWGIGEALAHASRSERLLPGELFATGTLPGGCALENGHWPQPGQTLTLTLDRVGEVEHRITA
ncbi:fumarylacetoacetate hydrolase family protein [Rhodococcus tibetensis]|uniref:Fumarylacetoacetate hydrolase family protein n=1 Tax=Rhodococcus tibetensis TaxID=2965064 RepID=A0ABT1QHY5_9NOCA|nr:fumarylacetoacetate hydrolase family protein [Rhodococcus sp. FXJ9.536]MCQ4121787.1 fumarylacetoacetate hydrolase family protein [Rhodococcus sp. FXJ9.536]